MQKEENSEHICKEQIGLEIKKTELEILEEKKQKKQKKKK